VKLPEHKALPQIVITDKANIFMDFPVGMMLGRRIGGLILYFKEFLFENKGIASLIISRSRLAATLSIPGAYKKIQWLPFVIFERRHPILLCFEDKSF
jgi:hypothetical protein